MLFFDQIWHFCGFDYKKSSSSNCIIYTFNSLIAVWADWELSDEEMGIMIGPFETMRSLFYMYGLDNLRMAYSATETMEEFLIGMGSNPPIL